MDITKQQKVRIDKWLWAARFFKTRSLAITAINGGKVYLNQQRAKPAKEVHVGNELVIRTGYSERTVLVKALSTRRGPASEAALLYEETPQSIAKRELLASQQQAQQRDARTGRPTKKERRAIHRFTRKSAS